MKSPDFHRLIEHAIRAPSGHNTQPWLFSIEKDGITISPDLTRRLPVVDPQNRELFISLGCAAENLHLAARHHGYADTISISDAGEIHITLTPQDGIQPDPLFEQIPVRQTNRSACDGRSLSQELLDGIIAQAQIPGVHLQTWDRSSSGFGRLAELVMVGNLTQLDNEAFRNELLSWIRVNRAQSNRTRDGLSYAVMGAPNLPAWITRPITRRALNGEKQNRVDRKKIASSSHLLLLTTDRDDPAAWVEAGRVLQRTLLLLSWHGIAHAHINQPCEVPALRNRIGHELGLHSVYPQILLRLGYAEPMPCSKRRPVEQVIRA